MCFYCPYSLSLVSEHYDFGGSLRKSVFHAHINLMSDFVAKFQNVTSVMKTVEYDVLCIA